MQVSWKARSVTSGAAVLLGLHVAVLGGAAPAEAACTTYTPASGATVTCDGANATGVIAPAATGVALDVVSGSIVPVAGPSVWLGADADIDVASGATVGSVATANTYAVLIGDGSEVTIGGLVEGQGGITGPTQGSGSTGFSNARITVDAGGRIVSNSAFVVYALNGRAGGNTYTINGEISVSGGSEGIAVGTGDQVTIGATGRIASLGSPSADTISGFEVDDVRVTMQVGGKIELHGIGNGIQLGENADVRIAGTIRSYGDAASSNSAGGIGIEVGPHATVWLQEGGQIVTGNTAGLGNRGDGGIGISTFESSGSNSTIVVDGLIDTQRAHGIFSGTGDDITIGSTGRITARGGSHGIFNRAYTSVGNDHVKVTVGGRIEALGTGSAIFLQADNVTSGVEAAQLRADVTILAGGSLFAQSRAAYGQLDGCCGYPEVIDNLIVAGKIERGNAGVAIDLNDGADTITLLPTYSIIGGINGGSNADAGPETDTFAFDGAAGTTGAFDFGAIAVTNFEAGLKKGLGTWTLSGNAGTGINGTFNVDQGRLNVNGTMTSTDFAVASGAVLGGTGTLRAFTASGTLAPGNSIGILNTGTGAFAANSRFEVEVDPASADRLVATGTVTIDPTAQVAVLAVPGTYADGTEYLILDAGTRLGAFGGVTDNSAFLDFMLDQARDPNQVWLTVARVAEFPDAAETPNQFAVAGAAEALGPGSPIFDAILPLDAPAARAAFDALSGEIHPSLRALFLDESRHVRDAVTTRIRSAFADVAPLPADGAVVATHGDTTEVVSAWGRAYGAFGEIEGDGNAATLDRETGGVFIGGDRELSGDWRFGLLAGYAHSEADVDAHASQASIDTAHVALYGGGRAGPLGLRFGGAYAWHGIGTDRAVAVPGFADSLSADYDAATAQAFGEAGYELALGGARLEPFLQLAYVDIAVDGFTESGGAAALTAGDASDDFLVTTLGLHASGSFAFVGGRRLGVDGTLGWRHAAGDGLPRTSFAFGGGTGAPFPIAGVPFARYMAVVDLGLAAQAGERASLRLGYSGLVAEDAADHGLTADLTLRF